MPDGRHHQPSPGSGLWTVLCDGRAFATVRAHDAAAAVELARSMAACSCLEKLEGHDVSARQATEPENSRWLAFSRDHLFECPAEGVAAASGPAPLGNDGRDGGRRRSRRRQRRQLLAASLAALMLLPISFALAAVWSPEWTDSIQGILGLRPPHRERPIPIEDHHRPGSPEAGGAVMEGSSFNDALAGNPDQPGAPAGFGDATGPEFSGAGSGGPEPHIPGQNHVDAHRPGSGPASISSPSGTGPGTANQFDRFVQSGPPNLESSDPGSTPTEFAALPLSLVTPGGDGGFGGPPDTGSPPELTTQNTPPPDSDGGQPGNSGAPSPNDPTAVPEPPSWIMLLTGFAIVLAVRRRHRRAS